MWSVITKEGERIWRLIPHLRTFVIVQASTSPAATVTEMLVPGPDLFGLPFLVQAIELV
jgi:hypothetical protein